MSSKTRNLLPVIATVLLGAALRILNLGHQSLWLDEFFSYFLARQDLAGVLDGASQDVLPPLYYIMLHFALNIGSDEASIRLISMFFSVLTLPVIFVLAKNLFNRRVARLSTLLLAISPLHVLYAQEARMHTMFVFFSGLALLFFWRSWQKNDRLDWLLFSLSLAAALYSHSLAVLNLLAIDIYCLIQLPKLKERWKGLLAAHVISLLLFLPSLVVIIGQLPHLHTEFVGASQSILTLLTTPHIFLFSTSLSPTLAPLALFAGLALVAFTFLSIWYALRERRAKSAGLILALCVFLVPVLAAYLISFVQPVFVIRRLLPASLGLLLLVSWTVMEARPRWLNIAAGLTVTVLMLASLVNYYIDPNVQKIPFREIVQEIEAEADGDDIFIHATDTSAFAFEYYAPQLPSHFLEGDPDYVAGTIRGRSQKIADLEPEPLDTIVADEDGFWLIVVMDHNLEYQRQVVEEFDGSFTRTSHETIHGVDFLHYLVTPDS